MTLQSNERLALVEYRKEKGLKTFQEAHDVASMGHWNLAVQRLYYSTYYLQSALLIKNGLQASTHAGVKALIGLHFVKTGLLSQEYNNHLGRLFSMWQTGDNEDSFDWERKDVEPLMEKTEKIITKLINLIEE